MNLPKSIQVHAGLLANILGAFHAVAYQSALQKSHSKQLGELLGLIDQVSDSGAQLQGVMQSAADLKEIYNRGQGGFSSRDEAPVVATGRKLLVPVTSSELATLIGSWIRLSEEHKLASCMLDRPELMEEAEKADTRAAELHDLRMALFPESDAKS
jgi:hypothetical protein